MENTTNNDEDLLNWINTQYQYLQDYSTESQIDDDINYFNWIGIHLTSFTIFETAMNYFFKNYVDNFRTADSNLKLINLPVAVIDSLFKDNYEHREVLMLIKKEKLNEDNRYEQKVLSQLDRYFQFTHFNSKDSNKAELKTGILFDDPEKLLLTNSETGTWFNKLEIKIQTETPGIKEVRQTESIIAHTFIDNYSSKIRHIIAHKIPNQLQIEQAKQEYPVAKTIYIFQHILDEMYKRYEQVHHHKLSIPNNTQDLLQNIR